MTIDLACAVERNYIAHSAVMLLSAIEGSGDHRLRIHYAHPPRFPARAKSRLASMVERAGHAIAFIEVPDELCRGLPTKGFTRKATWYRIFLPDLIPDADRVIYVDCDLLVLDELEPLWQTDLGSNVLGAVTNVFQHDHVDRPREIGIPIGQDYFNAGVLLMDLGRMRKERSTEALREFGVSHAASLAWRDQDALNLVLGSRRTPLHPRWNLMNSILSFPNAVDAFGETALAEAKRSPAVRHFEGPDANKPWHPDCQRSMQDLYRALRGRTPWPTMRPQNALGRLQGRVESSQ